MAYDALQETAPGRAVKEYLKILKLAAEEGEMAVGEALSCWKKNGKRDHGGVGEGAVAEAGYDSAGHSSGSGGARPGEL
jgi:hypothetical protein